VRRYEFQLRTLFNAAKWARCASLTTIEFQEFGMKEAILIRKSEHSSGPRSAAQPPAFASVKARTRPVALCLLVLALFFMPVSTVLAQTPTAVPVLTWRYDLTHAGQNTSETALTPANVNVSSFGKLFSVTVDSTVYAQPLYVPGLTMSDGLVHNVLFVATENDSIYAFDADSNGGANANPIWQASLLTVAHGAGAGATAVPWEDTGSPDVAPTIGITGTATINPATNTMYVVAASKENGIYFSRLHAIDILTGAEQASSPVVITATIAGTGNGSSAGQLSFSPLWENQRTALNYYNGYVYFGYGAHGDNGPWHGWLFAYNGATLAQSAVVCLSPNGYGAGVWESGAGMAIDDDATGGRMFLATGNGTHTAYPPFSANTELSQSVVDFNLANGGITPTDAFTSFNFQILNDGDLDLGSGGVLMVPDQQGPNPHILVEAGKEGRIVVLNRDNLGGYAPGGTSNTNALQDIPNAIKGLWNTPAYWNGNVYIWGDGDVPKLFQLNSGVLNTTPSSQSTITSAFPSPSFSVSSDGTQNGIAWAVRSDQFNTDGAAVLYAWAATDLTTPLYESDTNSKRDAGGAANKFSIPMVTNGKVYVAAHGEVDVYGLFNGEPSAAVPVITPDGGIFSASQSVKLSTATASANIYYTVDGSAPTPASTLYTGAISISADTTVNAIASAAGYIQSGVSSATFAFTGQTPPLSFLPAGGIYIAAQQVTISDTDGGAKIYYTTDDSIPSSASNLYAGAIPVSASETLNAIAIDPSLQNSNVGSAAYVIQEGGSSINFGSGFSSTAGLTLNGSTVATNDTRMQLTNGGSQQAGSVFWNAPIGIQAFATDFEFQLSLARGNGFTFTIQNVGTTALGGDSAGLGYQGIGQSVAIKFNFYNYENEGSNSTGVYTNGEPPVLPTVDLTPSGIQLASGDSMKAHVAYDGTTLTLTLLDLVTNDIFTMSQPIDIPQIVGANTAYVGFTGGTGGLSASQKLLTWTYATQSAPPTFAPSAGAYRIAQSVALSSGTGDAAIYYTTNGDPPTAASTLYTGPIAIAASGNIGAIAISPTQGNSMEKSAAYVIQGLGSGATFSLSDTSTTPIDPGESTTSTVTITPSGGFTGNVALTCAVAANTSGAVDVPACTTTTPAAISGTAAVTAMLTIKTQAPTTPGAYTATVTGSSGSLAESSSVAMTVVAPILPTTFTLSGTPISIASPGASGTSTITVTPSGGFTGSVALTCAVTAGPSGSVDAPTCSISAPAATSGTAAVTAKLTINTTASSTAALHNPFMRIFAFGNGATLAALLFFCLPLRRRKWQTLLGLLVLSAIAAASIGCASNKAIDWPSGGTSVGSYIVTVTGVSGSTTVIAAVDLTVE
jgi:hypothetical protein